MTIASSVKIGDQWVNAANDVHILRRDQARDERATPDPRSDPLGVSRGPDPTSFASPPLRLRVRPPRTLFRTGKARIEVAAELREMLVEPARVHLESTAGCASPTSVVVGARDTSVRGAACSRR